MLEKIHSLTVVADLNGCHFKFNRTLHALCDDKDDKHKIKTASNVKSSTIKVTSLLNIVYNVINQ